MSSPTPVSELTYEQARDELITIVTELESGTPTLAGAMELWERGEELANHCESFLNQAREKLKAVQQPPQQQDNHAATSSQQEAETEDGNE
ncbi:MAG TPA: exodeoxyribonuclease VII small subunit [Beutenbergiaceae bacterium]|nr:exodeoxyribonuclease VII small subunit [Beutenbergiaceae bacterium]